MGYGTLARDQAEGWTSGEHAAIATPSVSTRLSENDSRASRADLLVRHFDTGNGEKPWVVVSHDVRDRHLNTVLAARVTTTVKPGVPTAVPLGGPRSSRRFDPRRRPHSALRRRDHREQACGSALPRDSGQIEQSTRDRTRTVLTNSPNGCGSDRNRLVSRLVEPAPAWRRICCPRIFRSSFPTSGIDGTTDAAGLAGAEIARG